MGKCIAKITIGASNCSDIRKLARRFLLPWAFAYNEKTHDLFTGCQLGRIYKWSNKFYDDVLIDCSYSPIDTSDESAGESSSRDEELHENEHNEDIEYEGEESMKWGQEKSSTPNYATSRKSFKMLCPPRCANPLPDRFLYTGSNHIRIIYIINTLHPYKSPSHIYMSSNIPSSKK